MFIILSLMLLPVILILLLAQVFIARRTFAVEDSSWLEKFVTLAAVSFVIAAFWLAYGGLYTFILDNELENKRIPEWLYTGLLLLASPAAPFFRVRGLSYFVCYYRGHCQAVEQFAPPLFLFALLLVIGLLVGWRTLRRQRRTVEGK